MNAPYYVERCLLLKEERATITGEMSAHKLPKNVGHFQSLDAHDSSQYLRVSEQPHILSQSC